METNPICLQAMGKAYGTTKDWVAFADYSGLTIYYGKTGTVLRESYIPIANCRNRNSFLERDIRADKKRKMGYIDVDAEKIPTIPNRFRSGYSDEDTKDTDSAKTHPQPKKVALINTYNPEKENAFY